MISVGLFTGCMSNNSNNTPTNMVHYPVLSSTDSNVLNNAYTEYDFLKKNVSYIEAREQLLEKLNNKTGVEKAELGVDNYTIFITYADGDFAAVDTYELDEEPTQTTTFSAPTYSGASKDDYLTSHTISFDGFSNDNHYTSEYGYGNVNEINYDVNEGDAQKKTTCGSKNVLVLGPCYWDFPTKPTDDCVSLFKSNGWTNDDITLKLVTISPEKNNTDCMNLQPDDYFQLGSYGIILFIGHGNVKINQNYNDTNLYLQFCYLTNESFVTNPQLQTWKDHKQLIVDHEYVSHSGGSLHYIYSTCIRADLLRQQIKGTLPSSFIYFATCFGSYFNKIFLDKGAKIFFSWDESVLATYADANMKNIIQLMLESKICAYDAYANDAVVKAYPHCDPNNPIHGLVPVGTNGEPMRINVNFLLYPKPDENDISHLFYFPAWFDKITITGIPDEAKFVNVTLLNSAGNSVKWKRFSVSSPSLSIKNLDDVMFRANGTPTIHVTALDSTGAGLASGEATGVISAGANSKQIDLSVVEDKPHVEYPFVNSGQLFNITVDFTVSPNKWKTGGEVTATATCTCDGNINVGVQGFCFALCAASGEIVAYNPPLNASLLAEGYGSIKNGTDPEIHWGPFQKWGSSATFSVTFLLDSKGTQYPYILAWSPWYESSTEIAKIYLR